MSEESDVEKTEDPTPQRLSKARKEGQVPRSKELTSLLLLLAGWGLLTLGGSHMAEQLSQLMSSGLSFDRRSGFDSTLMLSRTGQLLGQALMAILPVLGGALLVALIAPNLLGGLLTGGKILKFDLKRLAPLPGLKRLFSAQALAELLKSVMKVLLAASACGLFALANKAQFIQLVYQPAGSALAQGLRLLSGCLLMVLLAIIPMVGYDLFHQITSHIKKLRMSRQEVRDEYKQQEGDPHIKGQIKQLQRSLARQRMMADVPHADVIINNPTHYTVALRYNEDAMAAPVMLAKGAGDIALRIREEAAKHAIPMLEAAPLARALYRHCEPGQPIPASLYSAVAEVLAWVYNVQRWRHGSGITPKKPEHIPVPEGLDFTEKSEK